MITTVSTNDKLLFVEGKTQAIYTSEVAERPILLTTNGATIVENVDIGAM
jgi:hypothetical protein